jgi:hypothetical protein
MHPLPPSEAPARRARTLLPRAAILSLLLPLLSAPALAALGSNVASIEADRAAMQGSALRTIAATGYSTYETTLPSGTVVREFALPSGTVFAVAWDGPFLPDLQKLLGTHFAAYADGTRDQADVHGQRVVQQPGLVVRSAGRMRAFSGQAYLPAQLPAGARLEDIR